MAKSTYSDPESVAKQLEEHVKRYEASVDALVTTIRNTVIVPFCKRRGYVFQSGGGTWWIGTEGGVFASDHNGDGETMEIVELLSVRIPLMSNTDIGVVMDDYPEDNI